MSEELAWAAGFFDGEGTVYSFRTKRNRLIVRARIRQAYSDKEIASLAPYSEVLERFQRAVGCGSITGPHKISQTARLQASWELSSHWGIEHIMNLLWPYLSTVKKEQFEKASKEMP
jgi:hypothetical protein